MYRKILIPLFILTLLAGLIGASTNVQLLAKAQPTLFEYAAAHPDTSLRVIVIKSHPHSRVSEIVASLGGETIHDLDMINAVAARVPAKAVRELASSPGVRWVAMDGPVEEAGGPNPKTPTYPPNYYLDTINVKPVWNMGLQGQGVTLVILDSGVKQGKDFNLGLKGKEADTSRMVYKGTLINGTVGEMTEYYNPASGHGTHVAGIAAGNGANSGGIYSGVAPKVNLIGLQISNQNGISYESDVVAAMQWVYDNKNTYNIRVVNMSFNSTSESSYNTSPMCAAAEILWFNGIVVVASAGNKGPAGGSSTIRSAPANDPFIITVGASDEKGNSNRGDDTIANFSASGSTQEGFSKPDIIAPGRNIISVLSTTSDWATLYPTNVVSNSYFRASGTSMAAPMVSAAAALLLQDEPHLTPDQVKYRLLNSGTKVGSYPYLDVYATVTGTTTQSANTGLTASQLLWSGNNPVNWNSVAWNSVAWNSVAWNSVAWNSVAWNSVAWNSVTWGP